MPEYELVCDDGRRTAEDRSGGGQDYNDERRRSSLGYRAQREFAAESLKVCQHERVSTPLAGAMGFKRHILAPNPHPHWVRGVRFSITFGGEDGQVTDEAKN